MKILRFPNNPIIRPHMDTRMGSNINGPSLIRVPDWIPNPLGRYYLYFAHHRGTYIRMAYSDDLEGPWRIHSSGVLDLKDSYFDDHIAFPDIRVMRDHRQIWMYYHGCCLPESPHQVQRAAISEDGLRFTARREILGISYWRVFEWDGYHYALAMPGRFYRSRDGLTDFEEGPTLFARSMRHSAVKLDRDILQVFYTNAGDCPERILLSTIKLTPDWMQWKNSDPVTILDPQMDYEGARFPLVPSQRGAALEPVRQLRDPCIYEEEGKTHLLYSVAGESGIAMAELMEDD
jgi:hypothetical protein